MNMNSKILRLVFDYSKNGNLVDGRFIEKFIEEVVTEKELHQYVKDLEFREFQETGDGISIAMYNLVNFNILIRPAAIQYLWEHSDVYGCLFNDFELVLYKNLMVAQVILHELEHASQMKQVMESGSRNDLEMRLLNVCFQDTAYLHDPKVFSLIDSKVFRFPDLLNYVESKRLKQKKFYEQDPSERLAEINSHNTVVECLEQLGEVPNLLAVERASFLEATLRGYTYQDDRLIAPSSIFLDGIGETALWQSLDFYDKDSTILQANVEKQYSLKKRLTLGLPVRNQEYEFVRNCITTY